MDNHQINQFSDSSNAIEDELQNAGNTLLNLIKNCNTIDKKLSTIKENIKSENDYKKIIKGILNGMLFDENMSFDNYFHILYSINNDSYKKFLIDLENVMSLTKLKVDKYEKIYKIFERLNKINVDNDDLSEILILICRNIYPGQNLLYSILSNNNINNNMNNNYNQNINPNNEENYNNNYFYKFLMFIKSNLNFILENDIKNNMPGIIFIKILRLLCETHIYHPVYKLNNSDNLTEENITYNNNTMNVIANTYQKIGFNDSTKKLIGEIYDIQIYILTKLYQEKKEKIFQVGRDLIRLLISVGKSNIEIIKTIYTDLLNNDNYDKILILSYPQPGDNRYAEINIPPLMGRMINFILSSVRKSSSTYFYYINWLYREYKIENCIGNTILVDIARYILTNYSFYLKNNNMNDIVPSWLILGYIIKHMTNQILSSELKQVLFMDLILFDKERDDYKLIQPSLLCIIINMKEFPAISEELIEFLNSYAKHFDNNEEKSKKRFNSIYEGFKMFEQKEQNNFINSIEKSIKESKMEDNFKNLLISLIQNENMSGNKNKNINNNNNIIEIIPNSYNTTTLNKNQNNNNSINYIEQNININNLINNSNNNNNQILLNQLNETDKNKNQSKKATKNNNKINKQSSDNKIEINIEITIPKEINTYIQTKNLKNFLKDKKQKTFRVLLNDICNYNIRTYGKSDSSIKSLDSSYQSLCQNFSDFFIKVFNDELELKDFENLDFSINKNDNNISNVYICLFDFAYENYEDNITFSFIADLINKIIEIYQPFILHLMSYVLYISINPNIKKNNKNNAINFFYQLNNKNDELIKEKLNLFFTQCEKNFLMNFLRDFFKYGGVELFNKIFFDDEKLIYRIIKNCDLTCINTIKMSLINNKFILIDKIFTHLFNYSFILSPSERNIFWNLVFAQGFIPSIGLEDFIKMSINLLKNPPKNLFKNENIIINNDEFFDKFINCILYLFKKEIQKDINEGGLVKLINKCKYMLDFDISLKKYIYQMFDSFLNNYFLDNKDKKNLFYNIIKQYFKDNNNNLNNLNNLAELLDYFSEINNNENLHDKNNNNHIIFQSDEINNMKNIIIKTIKQMSNS